MNLKPGRNRIEFDSLGQRIVGHLYCPEDLETPATYSAVVVSGPLGTVKEQAAGEYARRLAGEGFLALAIDFRFQGESKGFLENYDDPFCKGEDIQNAVSFLATLEQVDRQKIAALGICAGASYSMHGIVSDTRVKAFATVVAHFSLREFAGYNPMITDEVREMLLRMSNDARQAYFETGVCERSHIIYPEAKAPDDLPFSGEDAGDIFDYYYRRGSNRWPGFDAKLATMSYEAHVKSNALDYAKDLTIPYLGIVGSKAFSKGYTERFIAEILHDEKEMFIVDGARHVPAYDKNEFIARAVDRVSAFYRTTL